MDRLHTYNLLEFNKVLELVSNLAQTSIGKEHIKQLEAIFDYEKVNRLLDITEEAIKLVTYSDSIIFSGKIDLETYLKHVEVEGFLTAKELLDFLNHIDITKKIQSYYQSLKISNVSYFESLVNKLSPLTELEQELDRCIDVNGEVRDSASFEIRKYRKTISSKEVEVKNKLNQIMSSKAKMLSEHIITLRNNRQVLAVKSEYKHIFGGIIHDESISGQTVYIEPDECVTINNTIFEVKSKLRNEIEKILRYLASYIKVRVADIRQNLYVFTEIDVMFAKARYALNINGIRANISNNNFIDLINARHPLIDASEVISNDIVFKQEKLMVITGANTGGKTITLKTVGLFALMNQVGLFISANERSAIPIFDKVFTLMGDNQSLENNLSTFSSHLLDLKFIVENSSKNSLVLLDEIGNGTNPSEGSALAIAILEYLCDKGCKTIATTHYNELKDYAHAKDYVMNASVKFDTKNLAPTYRLLLNTSGLSYALMISERLGLDKAIIDNANKVLEENLDNNTVLLDKVAIEKVEIEEMKEALQAKELEINKLQQELAAQQQAMILNEETIIARAKNEANKIIDDALNKSQTMMKKFSKAHKHHELLEEKQRLEAEKHRLEEMKKQSDVKLEVGDEVLVLPFESKAIIKKIISENEYEVLIGSIKSKVKKENLLFNNRTKKKPNKVVVSSTVSRKANTKLDLRGLRVEEARLELTNYLDKVKLSNLSQVTIIHGYGTGAVRKMVYEYLKSNKYEFRSGGEGEGGSGATVVTL